MKEAEVHAAIRGLYEGILEPQAWQRSLAWLTGISGSQHGSMMIHDTVSGKMRVAEIVNPVVELYTGYEREFEAIDPGKRFAAGLGVGEWYVDARDLGPATMAREPFYGDFFRHFGLHSYTACLVARQPRYEVYFALQRASCRPMFATADTAALDWAIPHIRSAVAMRDRTEALAAMGRYAEPLLERLSFAVAVFDDTRRVLFSNGAGERWIRRLDPAGKTAAWRLSRSLADMIRAACRPDSPVPAQAAMATDGEGGRAQVIVMPLSAGHPLASGWQRPTAVLVVHEAGEPPPGIDGILRGLYGLTRAETRLATQLSTGTGLPECCERLGIRHETGRSQLKSIFLKTGIGTQAQLAHRLTQLAATLPAG